MLAPIPAANFESKHRCLLSRFYGMMFMNELINTVRACGLIAGGVSVIVGVDCGVECGVRGTCMV